MFSINLVSLYCLCIDKGGGGGLETTVTGVFLFFLCTSSNFLDILTWFRNTTAWARTPKMILGKHDISLLS